VAEPDQERLDRLGDRIDEARRDAEEDGLLPDSTPEPTFEEPNPEGEPTPADTAEPPG